MTTMMRAAWRVASGLAAAAAASMPVAADAQVNKCKQPDGTISFQSAPCAGDARPPAVPKIGTTTPRPSVNANADSDPYAKDGGRWALPSAPPPPRGQTAQPAAPQATAQAARTPAGDPRRAGNDRVNAENERIAAENARTEAYNRQVECNNARGNLAVLKGGHAVYRADNNGDRHYIDDKDRDKETANAQRDVAAACN